MAYNIFLPKQIISGVLPVTVTLYAMETSWKPAIVKHEIFVAVKCCGFSILNFSHEEIFADFEPSGGEQVCGMINLRLFGQL